MINKDNFKALLRYLDFEEKDNVFNKNFEKSASYLRVDCKKETIQFPDKNVSGVIVAGSIDDSLRQACSITDKVSLKIYKMSIELENA